MMVLEEKVRGSSKSLQFILMETFNVFTRFQGNPSNSCEDISLKTTNVDTRGGAIGTVDRPTHRSAFPSLEQCCYLR